MSDALAVALQQQGTEPGDRIAMYMQNVPQVLVTVLAAWKCGAVIVPCNPMLRERELVKILNDSGSRVLICQDDLYADVAREVVPSTDVAHTITTSALDFLTPRAEAPRVLAGSTRGSHLEVADLVALIAEHAGKVPEPIEIPGDAAAFMVYTSGTTGEPKAALNTHRNVVFATYCLRALDRLDRRGHDSRAGPAVSRYRPHRSRVAGLVDGQPARALLPVRCRGGLPARGSVIGATFTVSAVTAFIALLNSEAMGKHDLSSLTKVYTGGAPTPPGVLDEWHARTGTRIHPMYGLTEATSPTHMTPHGAIPPVDPNTGVVSIGVPVFNTDVRVVTDAGLDARPGEIGELVIAGPQIIPRYWRKPKETAASLRNRRAADGRRGLHGRGGAGSTWSTAPRT